MMKSFPLHKRVMMDEPIRLLMIGAGKMGRAHTAAFKTMRDAGVMLTFGSDWPGTNASWYTAGPMKVI